MSIVIKRDKVKILELKTAVEESLIQLPPYDGFGGSNDETKNQMRKDIMCLQAILIEADYTPFLDESDDLGYWLKGEDETYGLDYGIE